MTTSQADEFIVDSDKVPILKKYKDKIEHMYDVRITFDIVTKGPTEAKPKQWLSVHGEHRDRRNSKDYILALCHPKEVQEMQVSHRHGRIDEQTLEDIEHQTNAFITYSSNSTIKIMGTDLAVILAMSSLEEMMRNKKDTEEDGPAMETDNQSNMDDSVNDSPWSDKLDTSLRRALSEQSDSICSIDDYDNTPTSVKRVILQCLTSNDNLSDDGIDENMLFDSNAEGARKQYKLPLIFGDEDKKDRSEEGMDVVDGAIEGVPKICDLSLTERYTKSQTDGEPAVIQLPKKLSKELEYLHNFGLTVGYSEEVVTEALSFSDEQTQIADFLELLSKLSENKNSPEPPMDVDQSSSKEAADETDEKSDFMTTNGKTLFPPPPCVPDMTSPCKTSDRRSLPRDYKTQLLRDFTEEDDNLPLEELKKRNEARQQLLKAAYEEKMLAEKKQTKQGNTDCKSPQSAKLPRQGKGQGKGKKSGKQNQKKQSKAKDDKPTLPSGDSSSPIVIGDEDETCVLEIWDPDDKKSDGKVTKTSNGHDDVEIIDFCPSKPLPVIKQPPKVQSPKGYKAPVHQGYHQGTQQPQGFRPFNPQGSRQRQQQQLPQPMIRQPYSNSTNSDLGSRLQYHGQNGQDINAANLRYIVVDGSNIAMSHGNGKTFSCKGIQICIDHFLKRGHKQITVFVPHWRIRKPKFINQISDQELLTKLKEEGYVVFTPSREVNGKMISAYDDRFVLELAEREDGVIVSNDQYRDLMREKHSWKKIIEERLLMYTFAGDNFMIPEDPLGTDGPTLDEFLSKTPRQSFQMRKRPLSPDKVDRQQNHWQLQGGMYQHPNPGQRNDGLLPLPLTPPKPGVFPNNFNFPPPLFKSNQNSFPPQGRTYADGVTGHRGGHRGRGNQHNQQRARHNSNPQNQFSALKERSKEATQELLKQLKDIFSEAEQEAKIIEILNNHKSETDITRLTNFCMSALF